MGLYGERWVFLGQKSLNGRVQQESNFVLVGGNFGERRWDKASRISEAFG